MTLEQAVLKALNKNAEILENIQKVLLAHEERIQALEKGGTDEKSH